MSRHYPKSWPGVIVYALEDAAITTAVATIGTLTYFFFSGGHVWIPILVPVIYATILAGFSLLLRLRSTGSSPAAELPVIETVGESAAAYLTWSSLVHVVVVCLHLLEGLSWSAIWLMLAASHGALLLIPLRAILQHTRER